MVNTDVNKGLVNGALGTVLSCSDRRISIAINNQTIAIRRASISCRNQFRSLSYFLQFPLRLAYGLTSYKVQGQTLCNTVCIDALGMNRYHYYVAFSRSQSLSQLNHINVNPTVLRSTGPCQEIRIIRAHMTQQFTCLYPLQNASTRIVIYDTRTVSTPAEGEQLIGFDHYVLSRLRNMHPHLLVILSPPTRLFARTLLEIISPVTPYCDDKIWICGKKVIRQRKSRNPSSFIIHIQLNDSTTVQLSLGHKQSSSCDYRIHGDINIMSCIPLKHGVVDFSCESDRRVHSVRIDDKISEFATTIFDVE